MVRRLYRLVLPPAFDLFVQRLRPIVRIGGALPGVRQGRAGQGEARQLIKADLSFQRRMPAEPVVDVVGRLFHARRKQHRVLADRKSLKHQERIDFMVAGQVPPVAIQMRLLVQVASDAMPDQMGL
ncbi:hypothetical protein VRRI112168_20615 [Vreelandella rituensis]